MSDPVKAPRLREAACSFVAVAFLGLIPALSNGGPLLFNDSFVYLISQIQGQLIPTRPTFYGPIFYILAGRHLWGWLVLQSFLQSLVLHLWWSTACGRTGMASLAVLGTLTVLTPIAFEASLLLPDFAGPLLLVTSGLMLVYWDKLSGQRRCLCAALTVLFITFHLAHVALLAVILVLWIPLARMANLSGARLVKPTGCLAVCLLTAVMMISVQNRLRIGTWSPTPTRELFLFARFYSAGPLREYLQAQCGRPESSLSPRLCNAIKTIGPNWTAQDILWRWDSPMSAFQWRDRTTLLTGLLGKAVASDPVGFLRAFLRCGAEQFVHITVVDALYGPRCAMFEYPAMVELALTPDQQQAMEDGLQFRLVFPIELCDRLYGFGYLVGMLGLVIVLIRIRDGRNEWFLMGGLLLLGLLINALVCGGLSALDGRYQLRVAWLPLTFCALLACRDGRRRIFRSRVEASRE